MNTNQLDAADDDDDKNRYELYCSSYAAACDTVHSLRGTNPAFQAFLDDRRSHPRCQGNDLLSLLIMPIQRVPRCVRACIRVRV